MRDAFRQLDRILRGDETRIDRLRDGQFQIPLADVITAAGLLGLVSGSAMAAFAVFAEPTAPRCS